MPKQCVPGGVGWVCEGCFAVVSHVQLLPQALVGTSHVAYRRYDSGASMFHGSYQVHQHRLCDSLIECIKDGQLPAAKDAACYECLQMLVRTEGPGPGQVERHRWRHPSYPSHRTSVRRYAPSGSVDPSSSSEAASAALTSQGGGRTLIAMSAGW